MKGFGKFVTFVGVTGAALAGLWYFCEMNKDKSSCAEGDGDCASTNDGKERSYVSLDPEVKEEAAEVVKEVKEAAGELADAAGKGKDTLKKAVKSAAQDIMAKADDAAKGVGLVKEEKKTSDFEFEPFDEAADKAKKAAEKAADDFADAAHSVASHIDRQ